MAIKIPVSAQFDAADLKQQIQMVNDQIRVLASQVGQANKQKFEPINLRSKDDLNAFIKQMQKLLSIQTELKQTMGKTGQGATNPLMADWSKMYTDQAVRIKKMQSMLQFLGVEFNDQPAPKPKPPAPTPSNPSPAPQRGPQNYNQPPAWQNHLNTMLRNAGPVGCCHLLRRYQFVLHLREQGRGHTTLRANRFPRTQAGFALLNQLLQVPQLVLKRANLLIFNIEAQAQPGGGDLQLSSLRKQAQHICAECARISQFRSGGGQALQPDGNLVEYTVNVLFVFFSDAHRYALSRYSQRNAGPDSLPSRLER